MTHRPAALTVVGALQFAAFGAACIVLLGDATLDGELSAADVARAVGVALLGALVVGSTWYGGRVGWWMQIALALVVLALGVATSGDDTAAVPGLALAVGAVLWLALLALPQSRQWFLRPVE